MSHQGKRDRAKRMTQIAETAMAKLIEACDREQHGPQSIAEGAWDHSLAMEDCRVKVLAALESVEVEA